MEVLLEADRQAGLAQLLDEAGQPLADRLPGTELQVGLLRVLSGVAHAPRVPAHLTGRSSRIATPRGRLRRCGSSSSPISTTTFASSIGSLPQPATPHTVPLSVAFPTTA